MNFGKALDMLLSGDCKSIRRCDWLPDVHIEYQLPDEDSKMTASYLYVDSRNGRIPWIPNMVEMCVNDDWEAIF